jgi:hypothetical protein
MGKCVLLHGTLAQSLSDSLVAHYRSIPNVLLTETGAVLNVTPPFARLASSTMCSPKYSYTTIQGIWEFRRGNLCSGDSFDYNTLVADSRAEVNRRLKAQRFPDPRHLKSFHLYSIRSSTFTDSNLLSGWWGYLRTGYRDSLTTNRTAHPIALSYILPFTNQRVQLTV